MSDYRPGGDTSLRILVTGSRNWTNLDCVLAAIAWAADKFEAHSHDVVVVHGAARGLDAAAAIQAQCLGMNTEAHPANWDLYGKRAGALRNQEMVDAGADIVLAFPLGESIGTWDCIRRAYNAKLDVAVFDTNGLRALLEGA